MHIARAVHPGEVSWGFVDEGLFFPAGLDDSPLQLSPAELASRRRESSEPVPLETVRLRAPIPNPPQFIGVGLNYRDHAAESGMDTPSAPVTFGLLASAILDPGLPIILPVFTDKVDWEAELGIVIGVPGRDIAVDDALDHVYGYTIVNDVSARDVQLDEGQWTRAKSFDTFKPMGPWITTTAALGAADDLRIGLTVNGVVKQESRTSELIFSVPDLVSMLSRSITLPRGMVISTGTPSGVGFAREPAEYLRDGDSVTVEIEGIGALTNPVRASVASPT